MKVHKNLFAVFLILTSILVGLVFQLNLSFAGTWTAAHCAGTGGEGQGYAIATADQACLWPTAAAAETCTGTSVISCVSYSNNLACKQAPPDDRMPCGGGAIHSCNAGEFMNASGMCVRRVKCKHCGLGLGNPVDVTTGEKVQEEIDWSSGGDHPLVFRRLYNSFSDSIIAPNYSRLGPKWRSNFDGAATYVLSAGVTSPNAAAINDRVHMMLPDGNEYSFVMSGGVWRLTVPLPAPNVGDYLFWNQFRTDVDVTLTTTPTQVDARMPDGTHYIFDNQGLLQTITFVDGYSQSLTYVGTVNTKVTDSLGRKLYFQYDTASDRAGYLTNMITNDGKKFSYNYTKRSISPSLAQVFLPGYWALGTVTYPDLTPATDTDNPKRVYGYWDNYAFPFALTSITDERGIAFATWTYDVQGRAITSEHAGGQEHFNFAYDDINNKVTVTNPLGRSTTYTLQNYLGMVPQIVAVDGIATTNCVASNTNYTYDANGFRSQATDAEGRITQWTRNTRGLATTIVEGAGTAAARTTANTWDTTRPLLTQNVAPNLTSNYTYNATGQVTQISQVDTTTTTVPYSTNGQTRTTTFKYTPFTAAAPPVVAATGTSLSDTALPLINPGAELGNVMGWTLVNVTSPLVAKAGAPCLSAFCFGGTGSTQASPIYPMLAYQDVAIPAVNIAEVDAGRRAAKMTWKQLNDQSKDETTMRMEFLNAAGAVIASGEPAVAAFPVWTQRSQTLPIPVGTRTIRMSMVLPGWYYWFQSWWYFDDIGLTLIGDGTASAAPYLTVVNPDAQNAPATGWTTPTPGIVNTLNTGQCTAFKCFTDGTRGTDQIIQDIAIPADRNVQVDAQATNVEVQWLDQSSTNMIVINAQVDFLNVSNTIIAGASQASPGLFYVPNISYSPNIWAQRVFGVDVPVGARKIRLTFNFLHQNGVIPPGNKAYLTGITMQLKGRAQPLGSYNRLTSVDGPLAGTGDTVSYTYDANGYVSQITDEVGLISKVLSTDGSGRPTSIQDENGVNTSLAYDPRNRLTSITVNPGAAQTVTTITYDLAGDVTQVTQPDGSFLAYTWDNAKRLTSVVNNSGERMDYTYNVNSQVTASATKTSALVVTKQMSMVYDELGRLLRQVGAATQTTTMAYDRTDNVTQVTDPRSNLYGYAYDGLQRLVQTTDQQAAKVNVARDGQDQVVGYQDPRLLSTTYVRNGFGDVIRETSPDAGTTTYVRDARGLVTQMTDGRGIVSNMTYDNAGRLLTVAYPAATAENVTYSYDSIVLSNKGKGRLTKIVDQSGSTSFTYNVLGQVLSKVTVIGTKTYTTSFVYTLNGKLTQITYPSGRVVGVSFNSNRQVASLTTKLNSTAAAANVATGITYAPMSNLVTAITHGNGLITSAGYDLDYRLTSLNVKNGTTIVSGMTYAYGDAINLTGITDQVTAANSNVLSYTATNRLASASGAWGAAAYSYDGVGNRLSDVVTGTLNKNHQASYDSFSNRITGMTENAAAFRSYTYDGAGNIATDVRPGETYAYTYNKRNRLASVTRNATAYATYTYNALEQLTTRVTTAAGAPAGTVAYVYDMEGHLLVEADATTGATLREYIWLPSNDNHVNAGGGRVGQGLGLASLAANDNNPVDLPLAIVDTVNTTPTLLMVHADHLGRPIRITDATKATVWQAVFKPWGETQSISGTRINNLCLPGQYFQIETNLAYNWHRHYDPITGRYTQPDPLRFIDGPSVYAYAKSSPFMYIDRTGEGTLGNFLRVCGVVAGIITGGSGAGASTTDCPPPPVSCTQSPRKLE
jgi:RHS repeat-associated protein